jgi:hypothetical protein
MRPKSILRRFLPALFMVQMLTSLASADPLGTAFTYQGHLKDGGSPANGNFDMIFKLFDAAAAGNQIGPTLTFDGVGGNPPPVNVTNGCLPSRSTLAALRYGDKRGWISR